LREHPIEAGVDPDFRVLEEDEANLLAERVLDDLIESRFQEPEIFDLLRIYSEQEIRDAIQEAVSRSHTFGMSLSEVLAASLGSVPRSEVEKRVLETCEQLKNVKGKETDRDDMEAALKGSASNWDELERIKDLGKRFHRRGKQKSEIIAFRDALSDWVALKVDSMGQRAHDAFLILATDFETKYRTAKRERASLDFNDLEREAVRLIGGEEPRSVACRNMYQRHFRFVMVDEFQDTSRLQYKLISLVGRPDNLFLVGDWKQSIYGFRGADAALLLEKEAAFSTEQGGVRIPLVENFRSRPELLSQINPFFDELWSEEKRPFEPLEALRSVPVKRGASLELLTVEREAGETAEEMRMNEARILAERIHELVSSGAYGYKDFAMLFRVATDIYFYEHELRKLGVPYYVVSGRGFYRQPEVRDLISFLELLENPHLDIPLAAVLRSPLVQVSDDALFWLANASKRVNPNIPLYDAFLKCHDISEIREEDQTRLQTFRKFFFELLEQKEKWTISESLELILERTRYDRYVLGLPQGKRHFANLRKLLEIAREVEARDPIHLGDFIRYVKGLETQEVRESEAQVEALEGNVVKLMTIHKAKGLEFKVVIILDLNRKGEKRGSRFLVDLHWGLGLKVFNEATREFEETFSYRKIKEKIILDARAESKRLLYVGMTRSQDHLILSGCSRENDEPNEGGDFDEGANWFQWIHAWWGAQTGGGFERKVVEPKREGTGKLLAPLAEHKKIRNALEQHEPVAVKVPEEAGRIMESLKPIQPVHFERIDLPVTAYSVFSRSPEAYRRTYELGVLPEEQVTTDKLEEWTLEEDEVLLGGADFGTIVHRVFEFLVLRPVDAKKRMPEILERVGRGVDVETKKELTGLTEQFLGSKQFAQIKSAKMRYAEIPFALRLKAGIIQGTLDLLYQTRTGDWVILDYKTNRIDHGTLQREAEPYRTQMMLYALACHELLHLPVKRATLYFVRPNLTYDFSLEGITYDASRRRFEAIQNEIILHRKGWLHE